MWKYPGAKNSWSYWSMAIVKTIRARICTSWVRDDFFCYRSFLAHTPTVYTHRMSVCLIMDTWSWPIRTPRTTCANQDACAFVTPRQPNAISLLHLRVTLEYAKDCILPNIFFLSLATNLFQLMDLIHCTNFNVVIIWTQWKNQFIKTLAYIFLHQFNIK